MRRIRDIFDSYSVRIINDPLEIYNEYLYHFEKGWSAFPEIKEVLDRLYEYDLGILTNGDRTQQLQKLQSTGIEHFFKYIICAGDYSFAKPAPELFYIACEAAGTDTENMIYVGDNINTDINPCLNIGIKCVYINRSRGKEPNTHTLPDMKLLPELIKDL